MRQCGFEVAALGRAHGAHSVQAQRASDRRYTQNDKQAGENLVDTVPGNRIAVGKRYLADQHDPLHPRCPPPQHEGGAAEQEEDVKGDPLPRRRKIEEDRLRPGIGRILENKLTRHPTRFTPKQKKISGCETVVDQQCSADAHARDLQRRCRPALEPDLRPGLPKGCQAVATEACKHYLSAHGAIFSVETFAMSESNGCLPLNWSSGEKSCSSIPMRVIEFGCSAACFRQSKAATKSL